MSDKPPTDDTRSGYKPALLRGREFFEAGTRDLICTDADGAEKWRIAWHDIDGLAYVQHRMRGMRLSRLDLKPRGTAPKRSLSCTSPAASAHSDPEFIGFRASVALVADRLAELAPDLPVTIGEYGRSRHWIFAIGALTTVAALTITVLATAGGRGDALVGEALVPLGMMFLMGIALLIGNAPWRKPPQVPVKSFAKALQDMDKEPEADDQPG
ncbi:hypothetical protein [Oricola sp.]|uniref:hypothetical protein n=1 Tax=Oricola sp. TaxID=1979950 RepID=UPI0025D18CC6|nr:hypothetical protein [Oricola sp.]MCI5078571.1 hypothetical protein [Oricola sp.]